MNPVFPQDILHLLRPHPPESAVRTSVALMHHIALVYLRHKAAAGGLNQIQTGLSLEDLALDCIAGLFERDSQGRFCKIQRYFDAIHWDSLAEPDLLGAVRRLVFSHVNQEIYRNYRESDPTLHRIIRNLKEAASSMADIHHIERGGEDWISFAGDSPRLHLPLAPPEYIAPYISMLITRKHDMRSVLTEIGEILKGQHTYAPGYPIVPLSLLIRNAYSALAKHETAPSSNPPAVENALESQDLERQLLRAVRTTGSRFRPAYVGKGKVSDAIFELYLEVTAEILRTELLNGGGDPASYAERLRQRLPEVSLQAYMQEHRSILEYIVKKARLEYLEAVRQTIR